MIQPRSFFVSLLFGNLLLILVGAILGIGFLMIAAGIDQRSARLTEQFQEHLLDMVQHELQESWPDVEKRINQYCDFYFKELGVRLTVVDTLGRILGDSEYASEKMEPHLTADRPEMIAAMNGTRGEDVRRSKTTNIQYRYLASPIIKEGKPIAAVRIAFPVKVFPKNYQVIFNGVVLVCLSAMLILPLLLRWLWYQPIRLLNNEARRIAEGNLEPALPINGPLEMMQLSQSLETMRRTVSGQLNTITKQRESLQTILRHLPDAIFAINQSAEVIYFNAAAGKLFRIESVAGHPFLQEIVRNAAIVEWYLDCRKTHLAGHLETADGRQQTAADGAYRSAESHLAGTPLSPIIERKEIDLFGSRYFLELEFVETQNASPDDAACLLIVSDQSESVRANKMKTDFVANASHELRTPLAAIRAALDNVSEEVFEDRTTLEKILQIVDRHTLRLHALVEDLLALHSIEDESVFVRSEETSVSEQQTWIKELFQKRIDEKHLTFTIHSDFGDASFRVDNKRLGLILQNLVDNAIKFTPSGGEISLNFRRNESLLVIECCDTGSGIAMEEQQRIFERFYQADSSKTGDGRLRGTGLGLAIVKHAVERLKGSVSLESRVAHSSVFTVRIPVE
ncbi:MAG: HAMP domain-containing protein [Planctomycetaceae bacterium]|jgi:two-component system phosphate regulon sensor histidine kinase PhoR|nr:HAMP domain-containing protein [Planctomycetaceae bacterium]